MAAQTHRVRVGDTLTPFKFQLKYLDEDTGTYLAYDLTSKSAYLVIEDEAGNDVVAGTAAANECTVTDASNGKGEYDFKSTEVDDSGLFYMYVQVYSGDERVSFPDKDKQLRLLVQ